MTIDWRKSSRSADRGDCVELSTNTTDRKIRDSKNPDGPALGFSTVELGGFLVAVKGGQYDR